MSRWVPIPHVALELVTPAEYGAVADLYYRAHRLRWRPFRVSSRSLQTSWGLSARGVLRLVHDLEAAGLLAYTPGSPRKQSRIEVFDPTAEAERIPERRVERRAERKEPTPEPIDSERGTQGGTHTGTHTGTSSTRPETRDLRERESLSLSTRTSNVLRSAGLTSPEAVAALTPAELRSRPGVGPGAVAEVVVWLDAQGMALRPTAPRKPRRTLNGHPTGEAWAAAWKAVRGDRPYAWEPHRDPSRLDRIADVCRDPAEARGAFEAFIRRHEGQQDRPWPHEEPPTIAKFVKSAAEHVQYARENGGTRRRGTSYFDHPEDEHLPRAQRRQVAWADMPALLAAREARR